MTAPGGSEKHLDKRPYIAVTNELFRHPKFVRLTDKAKVHLLELWGYCNEYKTNGIVHESILNGKGAAVSKVLRDIGWVDQTTEPDMFYMHDYLDHQKSKEQIETAKTAKATSGSTGGKKSSHVRNHVKKNEHDPQCEWCVEDQNHP